MWLRINEKMKKMKMNEWKLCKKHSLSLSDEGSILAKQKILKLKQSNRMISKTKQKQR